ncbi:MAG: extracellular catalytic domain type 1 short-chain-length polyhydroxyalkanoate depolymerase [Stellaceae bacterium]
MQAPLQRRDPRLDFFRGAALFIIYIAHCRGNFLWDYIPARYGISDAANMFVFISGMTAAIAFGGTFDRQGWPIGTARIAYRCLQLYAAQIGMFCAIAALVVIATHAFGDTNYIVEAQLQRFFADPADALVGLMTLTYVPHYLDILPLYIVALAMVPVAMALERIDARLAMAASLALYLGANCFQLDLPANADDQPVWFFTPFAWQLIFFTGFAFRRGWIRVPLDSKFLLWASAAILIAGLAISLPSVFQHAPAIDAFRRWVDDHSNKTFMDPMQYVHFLASVYVVLVLLKGREEILVSAALKPFVKCGRQALSIFTSGMVLSYVGGMVFDHAGTGALAQILVNGLSFAALFAIAYGVAWFKAAPWKRGVAAAAAAAVLLIALLPAPAHAAGPYSEQTLAWQGTKRHFLLHLPPHAGDRPLPLVIGFHGYGDSAQEFGSHARLAQAADEAGMMVALPMSVDRKSGEQSWNAIVCCGGALEKNIDDVGFIGAMIKDIAAHHALNRSRVYATGHSNGATLVYVLAARHPDWFAAIAVVAGRIGGGTPDGKNYVLPTPALPMPVMMIHGTDDPVVPYDGSRGPNDQPFLWALSVADAVHFWASADRCKDSDVEPERVSRKLKLTEYKNCAQGSVVKLWTIEGGNHSWPADIFPAGRGIRSTTDEMMAFFKGFTRQARGAKGQAGEAEPAER